MGNFTVKDSTANANHGIAKDGVIRDGKAAVGHSALHFDGTTGYVQVSDNAALEVWQGAFSISFWLKPDSFNNNVLPRILEKGANFVCYMGDSGNARYKEMAMELRDNADTSTLEIWGRDQQVELGVWAHWVITFNGTTTGQWYKDGVANTNMLHIETGGAWSGLAQAQAGDDLFIARRHTDLIRNLMGSLDEIRIYNKVLSAGEVSTLAAKGDVTDSLVAHWKFDDVGGGMPTNWIQYNRSA